MEENGIILTDIKHSTTDHMSIEDWIKSVEDGMFVDYDGYGRLATEDKKSNLVVYPSLVENGRVQTCEHYLSCRKMQIMDLPYQFTHICWYNK